MVWRLALAAAVISIVLAVTVFLTERRKFGEAVNELAFVEAARFNARIIDILDAPSPLDRDAIQAAVDSNSSGGGRRKSGRFVFAGVYDPGGGEVAKSAEAGYSLISVVEGLMESAAHELPPNDSDRLEVHWIDDVPHIWVAVPLTNSKGTVVAHIEGVFAVSPSVLSDINRRVVRTVTIVIVIVLITTALLYPIIVSLLRRLSRLTVSLLDSNLETLQVLGSAVAKRDSDTDIHNYRVTIIAVRLAEEIGLDTRSIQALIKGAFVHDVGKIGIPDNILLKPGKLTEDEYEVMKSHVQHGVDIVKRSEWLDDATGVVGYHHEKFDGSGYSEGLNGTNIPLNARVFAIADVFDALTSRRPYKQPYSFDETMDILNSGRQSHFDPELIDAFLRIAKPIYDRLANRADDLPRRDLSEIIRRYFSEDIAG